ncbi:MAG: DNA gyrase subunit A [Candidatus Micrarchaeaceae archaeon]
MANITKVPVEDEMQRSYIDYAMSVIVGRAIPDIRDGLKPVQRRILYAMYMLNNTHDKPTKKSARVVGEIIGKYHPHGDIAVYDSIVHLAQDFSMNHILVEGQGNMGSIDGDPPAAMRYTEVRLTRLAEEMLNDIDKETVPFVPNFDNTEQEPVVLPSKLPTLLVNGASGIAVGVATSIPPHNLAEVCDAVVYALDNKGATVEDLLRIVKGPDFPTGGICIMSGNALNGYRFGRGQLVLRARITNTEDNKLVVTELPFGVNKAQLVKSIVELVKQKIITGIRDIRDESDKNGISIKIYLASGSNAEQVINQLYKHTQLEITFPIINLAVKGNDLRSYNLLQMITAFINYRREVVKKRSEHELKVATERNHIVEGLLNAITHIDQIIEIVQGSAEASDAKEKLQSKLGMSEKQAAAILDMRLGRLTKLEHNTLENEKKELTDKISFYASVLASPEKIDSIIKQETLELKNKYQRPRRTELIFMEQPEEIKDEDLIASEPVVVLLTNSGYVKRLGLATYKEQERGGKGVITFNLKEGDFIKRVIAANNKDYIMFVTNKGRVFWLKAYNLPEGSRYSEGRAVTNLLALPGNGEAVVDAFNINDFENNKILFLTRRGRIKKMHAKLFSRPRSTGIRAIMLRGEDSIADVAIYANAPYIFVATRNGKAIKFSENMLRSMGRVAAGVMSIRLSPNDSAVNVLAADGSGSVLSISEKGFGKLTSVESYRLQGRGGSGVRNFKVNEKTGTVAKAIFIRNEQRLLIVNSKGVSITIPIASIRHTGRSASGVRLMRLDPGAKIVDAKAI